MLLSLSIRFLLTALILAAVSAARWADGVAAGWRGSSGNSRLQTAVRPILGPSHVSSVSAVNNVAGSLPALVTQDDHHGSQVRRHLQPRSIDEWQLADVLIVGTVDGSLHARDRNTGVEMWTIPGDRPLVKVSSRGTMEKDSDVTWIVEPIGDGALFYFKPSTGLRKLSVSIRELIAGSPFSITGDDRTYTGSTQTTLYTINASTGEILKAYGAAKNGLGKAECRAKNMYMDFEEDEEEYLVEDNEIFKIGRTESKNGDPSWSVQYSTWGPNNVNGDLAAQHVAPPDNLYVVPLYGGSIVGTSSDSNSKSGKWDQQVSSAVINVFDLLRSTSRLESEPLVLLPHPQLLDYHRDIDDVGTYVERTADGQWFALSGKYFPFLVSTAPVAPWCLGKVDASSTADNAIYDSLVGVHRVELGRATLTEKNPDIFALPPSTTPLAIAPVAEYPQIQQVLTRPNYENNAYTEESVYRPPLPLPHVSRISSWWQIVGRLIENVVTVFLLAVFVVVGSRMGWLPQLVELLESLIARSKKSNDELANIGFQVGMDEVPTRPLVEKQEVLPEVAAQPNQEELPSLEPAPIILDYAPAEPNFKKEIQAEGQGEDASESPEKRVTIVEPEIKPLQAPSAPKKRKRGSRGGRKNKSEKNEKSIEQVASPEPVFSEGSAGALALLTVDSDNATAHLGGLQSNGMSILSKEPIGYGSHGTMVYRGTFENREVAIKRVLLSFYDIASQEVALLQESDDHANVIRYYRMCREDEFLYIALELCPGSLHDIIERPHDPRFENLIPRMDPTQVLYQITSGVNHLHSLKIVHRDIKPQNILVAPPKVIHTRGPDGQVKETLGPIRMLISDFGLCKKLEGEQTSFRATTAQAAGTTGWTAPEIILARRPSSASTDIMVDSGNRRLTRAVDIFSLGCVFYYTLTNGHHPFGSDTKRDGNVEENNYSLEELNDLRVPGNPEAVDLISKMISHDPRDRPEASLVLIHPFFWSPQKKLNFLLHISDRFEAAIKEAALKEAAKDNANKENRFNELLVLFEKQAPKVVGTDWHLALDKPFVDNLNGYRKYHGDRIIDLLRAMRNKCHHFNDLPQGLQHLMGPVPEGYLLYFTKRFPHLFMTVYDFAKKHLSKEREFQSYFYPREHH